MQLTAKQDKALQLAKAWWTSSEKNKRPFVLQGFAGTGKTSVVKILIESLGLIPDLEVRYVAFTGMASSVLTRKGNPATTIHRLIYNPVVKGRSITFKLKDSLEEGIKLLIVDEFSQINKQLMEDLSSFQVPMILIGDPFQLKPVGGSMNEYMTKPDIALDEVVRQALDNPITYLSKQIRERQPLQLGTMGDTVYIMPKSSLTPDLASSVEQIVTPTNKLVTWLNNYVRQYVHGLTEPFPYVGEKLMCLKNDWNEFRLENGNEAYLVNGLLGYVTELGDYSDKLHTFDISFKPTYFSEKSAGFTKLTADGLYFLESLRSDELLYDPEYLAKYGKTLKKREAWMESKAKRIQKFQFAYATTVYKSQGSEFHSVLYYDGWTKPEDRASSLYVAATRATDGLIMLI